MVHPSISWMYTDFTVHMCKCSNQCRCSADVDHDKSRLMANNKSPKNDFAPAWLKIPEGETAVSITFFNKLFLK